MSTLSATSEGNQKKDLQAWLSWQESLHLSSIDLGLDRIRLVAERMGMLTPVFPLITVAGTNGKGSTVAMLASILDKAGYQVGAYTSPHILRYNERIAINNQPVDDELICEAFSAIDTHRGDVSLTYFEFGTLAAMWVFDRQGVDIGILEVGLGGRLDAANLWDADVAVITSIGIDHVDWLGDDREVIGQEKAGIARAGRALVCGDLEPPESISRVAREVGADLLRIDHDFRVTEQQDGLFDVLMTGSEQGMAWRGLPPPALLGDVQLRNAACVLVALHQLRNQFAISTTAIEEGLVSVRLAGRLQQLQSSPDVYVDVAHNPHAAQELANWLRKNSTNGLTYVLFSMLSDKDVRGVVASVGEWVDEWHYFPLSDGRAMSQAVIQDALEFHDITKAFPHEGLKQAWNEVKPHLKRNDRVVAFGSFLVVSSMLEDFV